MKYCGTHPPAMVLNQCTLGETKVWQHAHEPAHNHTPTAVFVCVSVSYTGSACAIMLYKRHSQPKVARTALAPAGTRAAPQAAHTAQQPAALLLALCRSRTAAAHGGTHPQPPPPPAVHLPLLRLRLAQGQLQMRLPCLQRQMPGLQLGAAVVGARCPAVCGPGLLPGRAHHPGRSAPEGGCPGWLGGGWGGMHWSLTAPAARSPERAGTCRWAMQHGAGLKKEFGLRAEGAHGMAMHSMGMSAHDWAGVGATLLRSMHGADVFSKFCTWWGAPEEIRRVWYCTCQRLFKLGCRMFSGC